jgi:hypothetical protein
MHSCMHRWTAATNQSTINNQQSRKQDSKQGNKQTKQTSKQATKQPIVLSVTPFLARPHVTLPVLRPGGHAPGLCSHQGPGGVSSVVLYFERTKADVAEERTLDMFSESCGRDKSWTYTFQVHIRQLPFSPAAARDSRSMLHQALLSLSPKGDPKRGIGPTRHLKGNFHVT